MFQCGNQRDIPNVIQKLALGCKTSSRGSIDRKSVHVSNIDRLAIDRTPGACLASQGRFLNHVRYKDENITYACSKRKFGSHSHQREG